jgi:hypothetical protein
MTCTDNDRAVSTPAAHQQHTSSTADRAGRGQRAHQVAPAGRSPEGRHCRDAPSLAHVRPGAPGPADGVALSSSPTFVGEALPLRSTATAKPMGPCAATAASLLSSTATSNCVPTGPASGETCTLTPASKAPCRVCAQRAGNVIRCVCSWLLRHQAQRNVCSVVSHNQLTQHVLAKRAASRSSVALRTNLCSAGQLAPPARLDPHVSSTSLTAALAASLLASASRVASAAVASQLVRGAPRGPAPALPGAYPLSTLKVYRLHKHTPSTRGQDAAHQGRGRRGVPRAWCRHAPHDCLGPGFWASASPGAAWWHVGGRHAAHRRPRLSVCCRTRQLRCARPWLRRGVDACVHAGRGWLAAGKLQHEAVGGLRQCSSRRQARPAAHAHNCTRTHSMFTGSAAEHDQTHAHARDAAMPGPQTHMSSVSSMQEPT